MNIDNLIYFFLLLKVEREKLQQEEMAKSTSQNALEKQFQRLEEENLMLQRQVQDLQNTLADVEQQHAQRY